MEKLLIISSVALLIVTMLFLFFKSKQEIDLIQEPLIKSNDVDRHRLKPLNLTQITKDFVADKESAQIFNVIEEHDLQNYKIPSHLKRKNSTNTLYFSFDHHALANKREGDSISFQMLKFGINRMGVINTIENLEKDIVRFTGSFYHYPSDINYFTVTQTQKDAYAIVKVFTDKGAYIAEIKNGIGLATPIHSEIDQGGLHP